MYRIVIVERNEGWGFWRNGELIIATTPFLAAVAARNHGESLKDEDIGYEVILDTGSELMTLHTRTFVAEDLMISGARIRHTQAFRQDADPRND